MGRFAESIFVSRNDMKYPHKYGILHWVWIQRNDYNRCAWVYLCWLEVEDRENSSILCTSSDHSLRVKVLDGKQNLFYGVLIEEMQWLREMVDTQVVMHFLLGMWWINWPFGKKVLCAQPEFLHPHVIVNPVIPSTSGVPPKFGFAVIH